MDNTPQQVSINISPAVVFSMSKLFASLSAHKEKENMFLAGGIALGISALIYISVKPYPRDMACNYEAEYQIEKSG
nr:hypothetical protein [Ruminococcus flavefaciens]